MDDLKGGTIYTEDDMTKITFLIGVIKKAVDYANNDKGSKMLLAKSHTGILLADADKAMVELLEILDLEN